MSRGALNQLANDAQEGDRPPSADLGVAGLGMTTPLAVFRSFGWRQSQMHAIPDELCDPLLVFLEQLDDASRDPVVTWRR